jgi:hypothetical protein
MSKMADRTARYVQGERLKQQEEGADVNKKMSCRWLPTEEEVRSVRCTLRLHLKSEALQVSPAEDNLAAAATQLEQLFERTVQFGENQSGLLLGCAGSDRRCIVTRAMRSLRGKFGSFTVVYLNGLILQNELEAFKELTAQLTHATAVKHPVRFATLRSQ